MRLQRGTRSGRLGAVGAVIMTIVLALTGCSGSLDLDTDSPQPSPTTEAPRPVAEGMLPAAAYSVAASTDATELAIATSQSFVDRAQVAVLAAEADREAVLRAASFARSVGAPLLLTGTADGVVDAELLRLGVMGVITVGEVDLAAIDTTSLVIAPLPDDANALGATFGVDLTQVPQPTTEPSEDLAALVALAPGEVFAPGAQPGTVTAVGELPTMAPPVTVQGSVIVADGSPTAIAAVATATAIGSQPIVSPGDVRSNPDAIAAMAAAKPTNVMGIGVGYPDVDTFTWMMSSAATGVELPGGGQTVFDGKRYVALYGSPLTASLGLLGEQDTPATVTRATDIAGQYQPLTTDTVVPALEIIVTVATAAAGDDGNYSKEWPSSEFLPLIEAASAAGQYVVLDFQPGRSSFPEQVALYEDLLMFPNVGVALDPEWRLGPDERPLQRIGSVGIDEVNAVVTYLADFVRTHNLPQKLLILHQFQLRMIEGREQLDTSRLELAILIHVDGQGSQGAKAATWAAIAAGAPAGVYWGWKNFVDEDLPMLTPEQTYQVTPLPDFVSYQ